MGIQKSLSVFNVTYENPEKPSEKRLFITVPSQHDAAELDICIYLFGYWCSSAVLWYTVVWTLAKHVLQKIDTNSNISDLTQDFKKHPYLFWYLSTYVKCSPRWVREVLLSSRMQEQFC